MIGTSLPVAFINGRLYYSSRKDRVGTTRYGCKIIANSIDFL